MAQSGIEILGLKELTKSINKEIVNNGTLEKDLVIVASDIIQDWIKDTRSGKDVNNEDFEEYSTKYLNQKKKSARPHFRTSTVNLSNQGYMLQGIKTRKINKGAIIHIPSKEEEDKARWHNYGEGNNPKREFWGLRKKNIKFAEDFLTKKWRKYNK